MDKMPVLSARRVAAFHKTVYDYYKRHGRDLPWRETTDSYRILVSEVMLQQTQVPRVLLKYKEFMDRFPDVAALAAASLSHVVSAWQGLGYNRRALMLKQAAERIVVHHGGVVPRNVEALVSLPGIGPATSRAVMAFAFNEPVILIETNIRAVFIHHFFTGEDPIPDSTLIPLIEKTLDRKNPRRWYNALMDYGTFLKRAHANPARRSAHHQRQSPFEGSVRQIRGAVIRLILEKVTISTTDAIQELPFDGNTVNRTIDRLEREGLIATRDGFLSIA